jgi:hypothetical protein
VIERIGLLPVLTHAGPDAPKFTATLRLMQELGSTVFVRCDFSRLRRFWVLVQNAKTSVLRIVQIFELFEIIGGKRLGSQGLKIVTILALC